MPKQLPKYTKSKMKGNLGEAIAQYLFSNFALVHKIDGSNDLGNDFICELIRDQYPTNLLFYVQVKFTNDPPKIKQETLNYWKGSSIPVYVLWIKDAGWQPGQPTSSIQLNERDIRFKRFTPLLHKKKTDQQNSQFQYFNRREFLQVLLEDYSRTQYVHGFTPILQPRDFLTLDEKIEMNLPQYQLRIEEIISEYSEQIISNSWTSLFSLSLVLSKKNKQKALEVLELAFSLITSGDRKKYTEIIREMEELKIRLTQQ